MSFDLIVEIPPHRRPEREYVLSVLLRDWLGISFAVRVVDHRSETRLQRAGGTSEKSVVIPDVLFAPSTPWLARESLPGPIIDAVPLPDCADGDAVPLIYPAHGAAPQFVRSTGPQVMLGFDVLGALFFLLTRYEEHVGAAERDNRGRFPASASVLTDWVSWPVADMYTQALGRLLDSVWPGLWRGREARGKVALSHDVDHPAARMRWHGGERLRVLAADVARRRDPDLALRRLCGFLPGAQLRRLDPFDTFDFLMSVSESVGIASTFFFLTLDTARPDGSTYTVDDPWAQGLLGRIAARGHHVGLHGSYTSSTDASRIAAEWQALEGARPDLPPGVLRRAIRQHYLMWEAGTTWPAQVAAGLEVDESLGYADEVGYRAGTARAFPAFDISRRQALPLEIRPLHVMDVTLTRYKQTKPAEALAIVSALGKRTRTYGGLLSVLWHNSSLETDRDKRLYRDLVTELTA